MVRCLLLSWRLSVPGPEYHFDERKYTQDRLLGFCLGQTRRNRSRPRKIVSYRLPKDGLPLGLILLNITKAEELLACTVWSCLWSSLRTSRVLYEIDHGCQVVAATLVSA